MSLDTPEAMEAEFQRQTSLKRPRSVSNVSMDEMMGTVPIPGADADRFVSAVSQSSSLGGVNLNAQSGISPETEQAKLGGMSVGASASKRV